MANLRPVSAYIDHETYRLLLAEGQLADPERSLSEVVRHVLTQHAVQVETWLAGDGPRPATMLPIGDFDEWLEERIQERKRRRAGEGERARVASA